MRAPISRKSASLLAVLLIVCAYPALLGVSMRPMQWLILMSVCAVVLLLFCPGWYRVLGGVGLVLSLMFLVMRYQTRREHGEWLRQTVQQSSAVQPVGGPTLKGVLLRSAPG